MGTEWAPGYHANLYNLTDDAISVCPPSTRWLMVTNGDNEYSANFMQQVLDAGDVDLVAFDFYSRFQRVTAPACQRFASAEVRVRAAVGACELASERVGRLYACPAARGGRSLASVPTPQGAPACKRNRLRWCHTDLAANVLNYQRFMAEDRRFGGLQEFANGLAAEHFDGIMAQRLMSGNWKVAHLHDTCSITHSPSFQVGMLRWARREGALASAAKLATPAPDARASRRGAVLWLERRRVGRPRHCVVGLCGRALHQPGRGRPHPQG